MIKLPEQFEKWGYTWKILKRHEDIAILEQKGIDSINYNVVKIKKNLEFQMGENRIPAKESIPAPEQWGYSAWNYGRDIKDAENKFRELTL